MILPDFTVTALSGKRIRVGWTDADAEHWFVASTKDGAIMTIDASSYRKHPTIYRKDLVRSGRGSAMSYLNAETVEYVDLIAGIKAKIAADGLATKAFEAAQEARRQREEIQRLDKADVVRRQILAHGLPALPDDADPAALAAFYDAIQNSVI